MVHGSARVQQVVAFTDASGEIGCGGWWGTQYKWSAAGHFRDLSITQKEVLPVVMATAVWGQQWRRSAVKIFCDNKAAVIMLSAGYSRDPQIMHLLQCLFFIFQIELSISHIQDSDNTQADGISRNQLPLFFSQVPEAEPSSRSMNPALVALLVEHQPDWTLPTWAR